MPFDRIPKSWFCNHLGFCALHRNPREILPNPDRERAPGLREILNTNVKICAHTTNTARTHAHTHARTRTHTHARTALPSGQRNRAREGGRNRGPERSSTGASAGGWSLFPVPIRYPVNAKGLLREVQACLPQARRGGQAGGGECYNPRGAGQQHQHVEQKFKGDEVPPAAVRREK